MTNVQLSDRKMVYTKKFDIYDRVFNFTVRAVKFLEKLPKSISSVEYGRQLVRSSGSMGANLEEADGALTKKDFVNRVGIARRETRESRHWLKLISALASINNTADKVELDWLINESTEILLILSSIINKTQENS